MSRIYCLRMGSERMVMNILSLEAIEIHCFTFIFIHSTTVVYSRSYSDQFSVYRETEASGTAPGEKKQSGVIFKCLVEGQI